MRLRRPVLTVLIVLSVVLAVFASEKPLGALSDLQRPLNPPLTTYSISVQADPTANVLKGKETIDLNNTTGQTLTRLRFLWPQTDEKQAAVLVNDKTVQLKLDDPSASYVYLPLPEPLMPGAKLKLVVPFTARFDSSEKTNLFQGSGFHPTLWWGFPSHATYSVKLDVPPDYTVGTTGWFDSKEKVWRAEHVRQFGIFLGKGLQTAEAQAGDVQVRTVFTPAGSPCAHLLLDTAVEAINYYRQRFGFFPYRSLTIIPGADEPYGGYPASTALVVIHGQEKFEKKPKDFWRWITAHEVGHQYWSEYVLSRDTEDIGWLMIGLGIYADREYSRTNGMPTRHENFFEQYANGVRKGIDTTIERTPEQYREIDWDYNNVVMHSKGFSVISALAAMLGAETFDRIYTRCLREYAGRRLGWETFESIAEQESGIDLQPFFDQWVRSSRYPAYQITDSASKPSNGRYRTEVRVEQTGTLSMPIPVGAEFADGSHQIKFTDGESRVSVVSFDSASALKAATLDPNHEIAMVIPLPPMTAQDMAIRIDDMSEADDAEALKLSNQIGTLTVNPWRLRKVAFALYDGKKYEPAWKMIQKTEAAQNDPDRLLPLQAVEAVLLDLIGKRSEAVDLYRRVGEKIGTNRYQYYEIGLVVDKQFVEARLQSPYQR